MNWEDSFESGRLEHSDKKKSSRKSREAPKYSRWEAIMKSRVSCKHWYNKFKISRKQLKMQRIERSSTYNESRKP